MKDYITCSNCDGYGDIVKIQSEESSICNECCGQRCRFCLFAILIPCPSCQGTGKVFIEEKI